MRTDNDWHLLFRAGAATMPWRDEDDAVEWAESLTVSDAMVGELGMPAYMLFLSTPELQRTAAGLRRLARTRPADSDWLEDFATDLESDAAGIDSSTVRSNVPSGIHRWFFESRSVWWFRELAEHDARTLAGALAGQPPAELPILWRTSDVVHAGGDLVTAQVLDAAWGALGAEGPVLASLREALRDWMVVAQRAGDSQPE